MAIKPCMCSTNKVRNSIEVMTRATAVNELAHAGNDNWVALMPGGQLYDAVCQKIDSNFRVESC